MTASDSPGSSRRTCSATNSARRPQDGRDAAAIAARWHSGGRPPGPAAAGASPARPPATCASWPKTCWTNWRTCRARWRTASRRTCRGSRPAVPQPGPRPRRPAGTMRAVRAPSRGRQDPPARRDRPAAPRPTCDGRGAPARERGTPPPARPQPPTSPAWKPPGSAAPSAASSASPSRSSPSTPSAPLARATGNWPLDHLVHRPRRPRGTPDRATPGTAAPPPPPSPRTSTACPRTTTSTTPSSTCSCSSATAATSPPPTWPRLWLDELPAGRTFTAERIAYRNLLSGLEPPLTARHRNPFREWIGALIRADVHGWTNPGDPAAAAEQAHRDATLTHTANGVYAAMFIGGHHRAGSHRRAPTSTRASRTGLTVVPPALPPGRRPSTTASNWPEPTPTSTTVVDRTPRHLRPPTTGSTPSPTPPCSPPPSPTRTAKW